MTEKEPGPSLFSMAIVRVAFQVGCFTFLIIIVALIAGLFLDRSLETLPLFTILFLVGSMPLSWILVFWIVNRAKDQLMPSKPAGAAIRTSKAWEDEQSDREE